MTLTITHEAADAIDSVVQSAPQASETAGLRITHGVTEEGQQGLQLSVTDRPAPDDAVVEAEGASVFLDSKAAAMLDDMVLDAQVDGDRIGFTLQRQQA